MIKLKYIAFMLGVFSQTLSGQVIITPLYQNQDFFNLDHLMQVSLLNTSNQLVKGVLEIQVEDNARMSVLTVRSSIITLEQTGLTQLTLAELNPKISYGKSKLVNGLQETGKFPFGQYVFCYQFISVQDNQSLGVNCQEKTIKVFGLPELIYPADEEELTVKYPVLSWKPPLPLNLPDLYYSIKLVELKEGQTSAYAIRANPPLIDRRRVQEIFLLYPTDGVPLEEGKTYAWQVIAFADKLEIGATNIWKFSLNTKMEKTAPKRVERESYRVVTQKLDDSYYIANKILYLAFDNKQYDDKLKYEIRAVGNDSKVVENLPEIKLQPGLNKIEIDGTQLGMITNDKYVLKITDRIGGKFYLTFQYTNQVKIASK